MDWTTFCKDRNWDVVFHQRIPDEKVICKFSQSFNRRNYPVIEKRMDSIWNKITSENPRIYNAPKFRLHDLTIDNTDVIVRVGITDYKTAMCTNHNSHYANLIYEYGIQCYENKHACFADPIAVNCVVVTSDNDIVLMKRAEWVAEAKGMVDLPGGHAEPQVITFSLFCTLFTKARRDFY